MVLKVVLCISTHFNYLFCSVQRYVVCLRYTSENVKNFTLMLKKIPLLLICRLVIAYCIA